MSKGNIGVTSDNIFPVIKKFLYSDHEIFLRELISNAVDATQKLRTLSSVGEFKGELGDTSVRVIIDKNKKTLTVQDHGIGMTAEEVDKYINQIAFSGAEEFVNQYKDKAEAIIGHFGLGFYSAFMVADKVEIFSQSYQEDAQAVHWSCEGNPEYVMEPTIKADRGTDIVLHINDEFTQYLEDATIETLLSKYCKFLPVEIVFGKKKEWKDGKATEDSFAALAKEKTDDTGSKETGGLYEDITSTSSYVPEFLNWSLASHKKGDTGIIKTDYGYHIMYFVGADNMQKWESDVRSTIASEDFETHFNGITDAITEKTERNDVIVDFFAERTAKVVSRYTTSSATTTY